ncbi:hypothetical protein F2Q68_00008068 [Brassica cretica]|uniref:Uncharacterized protein n=1 Tax=Brassica cretica TaxID=69181 RepID=A0A8S9KSM4_BRACR|nr:hypothetical protein F2Q68_00008068 [Brassica cretica]
MEELRGPVAGSNSIPADSIGVLGDFSLQLSGDQAFGDNTMKKKKESTVGEEYSLFAESNSLSGPVAGSNSIPADSIGVLGDFSLQLSGDQAFGDNTMKKKKESTVGEEYSVFAESNSLRFTIF